METRASSSSGRNKEMVRIEVDDGHLIYDKETLVKNSIFFQAMFSGNYRESQDKSVKIQGVDIRSMRTVMKLMEGQPYRGSTEEVLMVLYTASMLNFQSVVEQMVNICVENMNVSNCLNIKFEAERQNLTNLYCKAMRMALSNFLVIKDSEEFFDLNLSQLQSYVGDRYLDTPSEMTVFEAVMKWWSTKVNKNLSTNDLIKALSTLDIKTLTVEELEQIENHKNLEYYPEVRQIVSYIREQKLENLTKIYTEEHKEIAQKLCDSESRMSMYHICLIAYKPIYDDSPKKRRTSDDKKAEAETEAEPKYQAENPEIVIYKDRYNRKRTYQVLQEPFVDDVILVYYDVAEDEFRKLIPLNPFLLDNQGFRILSNEQNIFIMGGEFALGSGQWNLPVWMYDSNSDSWKIITKMKRVRRHFQCCIIGDVMYIVGGTKNYRVIAEDMFYYDLENDHWSDTIQLPCFAQTGQCCVYLEKLAIVQLEDHDSTECGCTNNKAVHLYNSVDGSWEKMLIVDEENFVPDAASYKVTSHAEKIYIVTINLIAELQATSEKTFVVHKRYKLEESHEFILDSEICSDIVFTLYQDLISDCFGYSLHMYNVKTMEESYVFKDVATYHLLDVEDDWYRFNSDFKTFKFKHYKQGKNLVNENFR